MKHLFNMIKGLKSHRLYVSYSLAYGLSTLIVPLGVQYLVNNLALSGIWLNVSAFILFILLGLIVSYWIKHSQLVLLENLQREIFFNELNSWKSNFKSNYSHYYFEIFNVLKSFSKSYASIIELLLVLAFGLLTIMAFHPFFVGLAIIITMTLYQIYVSSKTGLATSIKESDEKYKLYQRISSSQEVNITDIVSFLEARDDHFGFIRKNSFKLSVLAIAVQGILLLLGCYLIQINQLSVGQLVSAEIIISGIFVHLSKLPLTLEAIYDFETSKYKIEKSMKEKNA